MWLNSSFFFQINLYFWKEKKYLCILLEKNSVKNLTLSFGKNNNKISKLKNDVLSNVLNEVG